MALGMTTMPATEEELELQDQVAKALESHGVLSKIRAQLRVAVFQAIHSNGNGSGNGTLSPQSSLSTILPGHGRLHALGADGHVVLEIVRNFLECLELEHTLTVFLAEANLDGKGNDTEYDEWRQPARLCERVGVTKVDEQTPVLVKLLNSHQRTHGGNHSEPQKVSTTRDVAPPNRDLPSPPSFAATLCLQGNPNGNDNDDDGESEMEASMAEEVASGSFEEESLAESASLNTSEGDSKTKARASQGSHRAGKLELNHEENEDESPSIASPPPVPTKLGMMSPLPGLSTSRVSTHLREEDSVDDQEALEEDKPTDREEHDDEEEEEEQQKMKQGNPDQHVDLEDDDDDGDAADRLRSLEAKLKEMEAEDDTGMLQQLKITKLEVRDGDGDQVHDQKEEDADRTPNADNASETDARDDEDDDNYGSDFEEVEEDVDDDVGSELSEDIASMSALSESEEVSVAQAEANEAALQNDKAVDSEDALNSYDYIEAVEKD